MVSRSPVRYKAASVVRLVAPIDVVNLTPLNTAAGAAASFQVFDPAKFGRMSVAGVATDTVLSVTNSAAFQDGDAVQVELDSGSLHDSTITTTDPGAGTITIADQLPSGVAVNRRVRVTLGGVVSMSDYGTPNLARRNWGFLGTFLSSHPAQVLDLEIDIEITLTAPGSLDTLEVICAVIRQVQDC